MNDKEVNKIIAEFMGFNESDIEVGCYPKYTNSLDALVPVWEKLKTKQVRLGDSYGFDQCQLYTGIDPTIWSDGKTVQQAAAHATAKAIKEIGGSDE